jgi:hypothetical protein
MVLFDSPPSSKISVSVDPVDFESGSESESEIICYIRRNPKRRKRLFKNCAFVLKSGNCCKLNAKEGTNRCWRHS